jgi:hypothetical protein
LGRGATDVCFAFQRGTLRGAHRVAQRRYLSP